MKSVGVLGKAFPLTRRAERSASGLPLAYLAISQIGSLPRLCNASGSKSPLPALLSVFRRITTVLISFDCHIFLPNRFLITFPIAHRAGLDGITPPSIGSQKENLKYKLSLKVIYIPLNREASRRAKSLRSSKSFIYFFMYPHKAPSLNSHENGKSSPQKLKISSNFLMETN